MNVMTMFEPIVTNGHGSEADALEAAGRCRARELCLVVINSTGSAQGKIDEQLQRLGFGLIHIREDLAALDDLDRYAANADAVLLDWRCEAEKSYQFADALARKCAEVGLPVLTLAASSRAHDIQLALEAGLSNLLSMPCQLADLKAAVETLGRHGRAAQEPASGDMDDAFTLLDNCRFRFRTPEDVDKLVPLIARMFPRPERAASGIAELMMNAIEHGNLEIGHERKADWVARRVYQNELLKRLHTPPYSTRWAEVIITRRADGVMIVIMDEGCGFCWQNFIGAADERKCASDTEAGGIAKAQRDSFDDIRFNHLGNQVTAFASRQSAA